MDIKDLKIVPPEGMEYYIEGSEIKFRPKKEKLTYDDIAKELFYYKMTYYVGEGIKSSIFSTKTLNNAFISCLNNCTSEKQAKKLLAINQLMNVAKYLNGDWQPNWSNKEEHKCYIGLDRNNIRVLIALESNINMIYFKTKEFAKKAIEILGEETIRLALSTDW